MLYIHKNKDKNIIGEKNISSIYTHTQRKQWIRERVKVLREEESFELDFEGRKRNSGGIKIEEECSIMRNDTKGSALKS